MTRDSVALGEVYPGDAVGLSEPAEVVVAGFLTGDLWTDKIVVLRVSTQYITARWDGVRGRFIDVEYHLERRAALDDFAHRIREEGAQ